MKRRTTKLALAVATALGTAFPAAQAVELADDGLGDVLIFPYYTVRNGYDTYLNVTNTSADTVAVKIRFREAHNSRDVRDFNIILSPYDVWTGAVTMNPAGTVARIQTNDTTCTAPPLFTDAATGVRYVDFTNLDYIDLGDANNEDWDSDTGRSLDRANEGYVTIISMGAADAGMEDVEANVVPYNAKHVDGVPRDCAEVAAGFTSANLADTQGDFDEPRNVLKGAATMIKVDAGKAGGYDAVALANFFSPTGVDGASTADIIREPRDQQPNFSDTTPMVSVVKDTDFAGTVIQSTWLTGQDAVSAVLMRDNVINQFSVAASNGAETDWVVTFPTKYFYVDERQNVAAPDAPFTESFQDGDNGQSCDVVTFNLYDREEFHPTPSVNQDFSPPQPGAAPSSICKEVNVLTFDQAGAVSNVFGSKVAAGVDLATNGIETGFMKLTMTEGVGPLVADSGEEYNGRPVVGFAFTTLENGVAGANLLNYGSIWEHGYTRSISASGL